jgi:hypothetical protein
MRKNFVNFIKSLRKKFRSINNVLKYYIKYKKTKPIIIFMLDESGIVFLKRLITRFEDENEKLIIIVGMEISEGLEVCSPSMYVDTGHMKYLKGECIISQNTGINKLVLSGFRYRVHTFHSPISMMRIYPEGAFDAFNVFVASGKHHVEEIKEIEKRNGIKIKTIKGGYLRIEDIYNHSLKYERKNKKKTIIIAPSWGRENIVNTVGKDLIGKLLKENFNIIFRPHPGNLIYNKVFIDEILDEYLLSEGFKIDSWKSMDYLCESDVLIGDWSGISYEFASALNRPVIFINTDTKYFSNHKTNRVFEEKYREEFGAVVEKDQIDLVPDIAKKMINDKLEYEKKIKENKVKHFYNVPNCSHIIKDEIVKLVK